MEILQILTVPCFEQIHCTNANDYGSGDFMQIQIALRYPTVTCPGCKSPMTPSPPLAVSDDTDLYDVTYTCKSCGTTTRQRVSIAVAHEQISLRRKLGAILYDLPHFVRGIGPSSRSRNNSWVFIRGRRERLVIDGRNLGAQCDWEWVTDLHIAKVFPALGLRLMKEALHSWPIAFRHSPQPVRRDKLEISFVIGHRGAARLPHLLTTLACIAAQRDVALECIVVEQAETPETRSALPDWVRYVHAPPPLANAPYNRARALNVGARIARTDVLVLHDNDLLIPEKYASEVLARMSEGHEVVNLKRFVFYLAETHTRRVLSGDKSLCEFPPERVLQNAKGGSLAITRAAYSAIGGHDEDFVGWGGEDDEFWQRARTRQVWPYSYLPLLHLWHAVPGRKYDHSRRNMERYSSRSAIPVDERIRELTAKGQADVSWNYSGSPK